MAELYSFGAWVRRRRKSLDLTQAELANRVGCAESMLRKIEADARRPSRQVAERLANALELPAAERDAFLKAARAELVVDQLALPPQPVVQPHAPVSLPSGTVTFLFTDIESSTRLWEQHPQAMQQVLARHDAILRETVTAHGGSVVKTTGDGLHVTFARAMEALHAALAAQRALAAEAWGAVGRLGVRMVLHTGVAEERDGDYYGPALNRAARLLDAGHGGQVLLSQATEQLIRDYLPPGVTLRDLGTHHLKDLDRPEHLFQLLAPDLPAEFPPLRTLERSSHRLPAQATALIGRQREVQALCDLVRHDGVRLVTLTGPGGIGKTRLALQVAADLTAAFADGVHFVNLAPVSDPELVVTTIAQVLGVREAEGRPLAQELSVYLRSKHVLLVLDNFEQVVAAALLVGELLAAAPGLKVLVTSREPLHLAGEHEYAVPPLLVPDPQSLPLPECLAEYEAVQLFLARAQRVKADFAVTSESAPAIATICHRLDGLPLAIELAAARVKLLSPHALLARLDQRLTLLTGGARDAPVRQQTMRATIDWSYQLLDAGEQLLFARFGVFVGGCTLEAAEAVCNTDGGLPVDVLEGTSALVDKSLVKQGAGAAGEPRFTMLETIRAYALEHLAASGEETAARHAHLAYYLALAEAAEPHLSGAGQERWLQHLETEHDNLRQALHWSLEQGDATTALRLGGALWRFWYVRSHLGEGRRWLEQALEVSQGAAASLRLKALLGAGLLTHYLGDFSRAGGLFGDSLALARQLDDQAGIAEALKGLALVARNGGNYAAARAMYTEALALLRPLGDRGAIAHALAYQAAAAWTQADYGAARSLAEEGLALYRELGDRQGIATAANIRGYVAAAEHDDATAHALQSESLLLYRQLGDRRGSAKALNGLSEVAFDRGDYALARALGEESVALFRQVGDMWCIVEGLEQLARLAAVEGQHAPTLDDSRRAVQIYGAAEALRIAIGAPLPPHHSKAYHAAILPAVRNRLGEEAFGAAWRAGRTLSLEQAIALAMTAPHDRPGADAGVAPAAVSRGRMDAREYLGDLTAREIEVLRLVAEGLTDAQVALKLTISPRTVQRHLSAIYSKLQVTSRTAAARLAIAQGLG